MFHLIYNLLNCIGTNHKQKTIAWNTKGENIMQIKKCCNKIDRLLNKDYINIHWGKSFITIGDVFNGYIMKHCPYCGKRIEFEEVYNNEIINQRRKKKL